jgi:hypothetical protein
MVKYSRFAGKNPNKQNETYAITNYLARVVLNGPTDQTLKNNHPTTKIRKHNFCY